MRKAAVQVDCGSGVLDIAGTGGDGCVRPLASGNHLPTPPRVTLPISMHKR